MSNFQKKLQANVSRRHKSPKSTSFAPNYHASSDNRVDTKINKNNQKNTFNDLPKAHPPKAHPPKTANAKKANAKKANAHKPTQKPACHQNPRQKSAIGQSADEPISDFSQVNFLTVSDHQDDQRLDNFLLARLKGLPRSHVYKMITSDEIRINKKRAKPHTRLVAGDVVRVAPVRLSSVSAPVVSESLQAFLLSCVVYEDDGLLVLNKPSGMAVHGGSGEQVGVIEAMRVATQKPYLELVHRLDKGTSGLLMIAKKRRVLKQLQAHLRQKTLQKSYLCLVWGRLMFDGVIDKPLTKFMLNGERRVKVDKNGKESTTTVTPLGCFDCNDRLASVVLAQPKTGRTHQIRVHLTALNHPLLGDDKYGIDDGMPRLFLHAWRLVVDGYPSFYAPPPPAFFDCVGKSLPKMLNGLSKASTNADNANVGSDENNSSQ